MKFRPYTTDEMLILFEAINCIEDIQIIADYLHQNRYDYSPGEFGMLKRGLMMFAGLWV